MRKAEDMAKQIATRWFGIGTGQWKVLKNEVLEALTDYAEARVRELEEKIEAGSEYGEQLDNLQIKYHELEAEVERLRSLNDSEEISNKRLSERELELESENSRLHKERDKLREALAEAALSPDSESKEDHNHEERDGAFYKNPPIKEVNEVLGVREAAKELAYWMWGKRVIADVETLAEQYERALRETGIITRLTRQAVEAETEKLKEGIRQMYDCRFEPDKLLCIRDRCLKSSSRIRTQKGAESD